MLPNTKQLIDTLFEKIEKTNRKIKRVLKESETQFAVAKSEKPLVKPETEEQKLQTYEGTGSVVVNLKKVTASTNKKKEIVINELGRLVAVEGTKLATDMELTVRDMVADLTKVLEDLRATNDEFKDGKIKTVEDVRMKFRLFITRYKASRKKIAEYEQKRAEWQTKINFAEYEAKLEQLQQEHDQAVLALNSQYDMETMNSIDDEISRIEEETSSNLTEIEATAKDNIRNVRAILTELYDAPKELFDTVQIYIKAMGAVASISPMVDRYNMNPLGFQKILANPELMAQLGEFISEVEYSDRVAITNVKIKELGTYFSELNLKSKNKIKSFEQSEKELNEGVFGNIASKAMAQSFVVYRNIIDHVLKINKLAGKKLSTVYKSVHSLYTEMSGDGKTLSKNAGKAYLSVKKEIEMVKANHYADLEKQIK